MRDHSSTERAFSMVQVCAYAVVFMTVLAAPMAAYLPRPAGKAGVIVLCVAIIAAGLACGAMGLLLHRVLSAGISKSLLHATGLTGGASTTPHFAMSPIEGLIVRRQYDEAAEQLTDAMYAHRGETGAEIAQTLGDLLSMRIGSYEAAARAYGRARREWQTAGGQRGRDGAMQCSRRLLDLYEGPLSNDAAANAERARLGS